MSSVVLSDYLGSSYFGCSTTDLICCHLDFEDRDMINSNRVLAQQRCNR